MPVYLNGLMLGLSLVMALGPQNIFLIRQGTLRKYALTSVITCFICDAIMVSASVTGLHHLLEIHPQFQFVTTCFGGLFLAFYGIKALKQSLNKKSTLNNEGKAQSSRLQIILLALGFSLLNPHAIIDSIVIIGGGSVLFPGHEGAFLFGVLSSSLIWFSVLTLTTFYFSHILSQDYIWKKVEMVSGIVMLLLSVKLISTLF
jgi:L-lysine exporter family protein LysE/ArgO